MGETQGTIHPWGKFFNSEPVKLDKLSASKIHVLDRHRFPFQKGKLEKGVTDLKQKFFV